MIGEITMKKFEPWLKKKAAKSNIALGAYLICMGITAIGYAAAAVAPLALFWILGYAMGGPTC